MNMDKQRVLDEYLQNKRRVIMKLSGEQNTAITRIKTDKQRVSLTFDCGYGQNKRALVKTVRLLLLSRIHCTFFVTGQYCRLYPKRVKALHLLGMEIMNHSDTHKVFTNLSDEARKREINECNQAIEKLTGRVPTLFRFPEGEYGPNSMKSVLDTGLVPIQWDIDTTDWKNDRTDEEVYRVIVDNIRPGSIILCHESGHCYKGIRKAVHELQKKGYSFVKVTELLGNKKGK